MKRRINPDRLHTLGHPLSNGRKCKENNRDEYIDRYGRTENTKKNNKKFRWINQS